MDVRWWCLLAFLLSSACGVTSSERNTEPYKLVCVKGYDSYNDYEGDFEDADYSKCTHVVYNNAPYYHLYRDEDFRYLLNESLQLVPKLRAINPNIAQLISWNGWVEAPLNYLDLEDPEELSQRLKILIDFLTEFDLDGVDLTWHNMLHLHQGIFMMSKDKFTDVVQTLGRGLHQHGFLLTATVNGRTDLAEESYDVPKLSQCLDFINVMGYDLLADKGDENTAQHSAPVDSLPGADGSYSVNSALKYWLDQGADPHKLVLGVSTLARLFRLKDDKENGPFAPVDWWNSGSPFPRSYFLYVGYPQICSVVQKNPEWTVVRNERWQAPYSFVNDTWVSYDDEVSVAIKMDLVSANGLGGAMIDFYGLDADPSGFCDRKYPLSSVILDKLEGKAATTFDCRRGGFFEYPGDCTKYYECVPKSRGYEVLVHDCDQGLGYDARVQNCVRRGLVRSC